MEINTRVVDGVQVVSVSGSVDAGTAEKFEQGLMPLTQGQEPRVLVDMSDLSYMSSAGLRILLSAQKAAKAQSGEVILVAMQEPVQEVFAMVGFDVLFRSFPTLEQALEALGQ
ncbi:MAG: STAS domain-containing protein [Chloroflexia bacterium]|nr:STAS domain-containing protein [Chloroflexia bacterium]